MSKVIVFLTLVALLLTIAGAIGLVVLVVWGLLVLIGILPKPNWIKLKGRRPKEIVKDLYNRWQRDENEEWLLAQLREVENPRITETQYHQQKIIAYTIFWLCWGSALFECLAFGHLNDFTPFEAYVMIKALVGVFTAIYLLNSSSHKLSHEVLKNKGLRPS